MINEGDKVRIIRVTEGCEEWGYKVGDIYTVERVTETPWQEEPIIDVVEGDFDLYLSEVELVEPPKDYEDDASIFEELSGHGESEARGILQKGITEEQALEARNRAIAKVRKDELDAAVHALEKAKKRYEEVSKEPAEPPAFFVDGTLVGETVAAHPGARVMAIAPSPNPLGDIMERLVPGYGNTEGHPHGINSHDPVGQPEHYVNSRIEPIDYMADKLPAYTDGHTAFCVGNVIKYVSRAPHKGTFLQDLRKARQYLDFAIEHEEKKEQE